MRESAWERSEAERRDWNMRESAVMTMTDSLMDGTEERSAEARSTTAKMNRVDVTCAMACASREDVSEVSNWRRTKRDEPSALEALNPPTKREVSRRKSESGMYIETGTKAEDRGPRSLWWWLELVMTRPVEGRTMTDIPLMMASRVDSPPPPPPAVDGEGVEGEGGVGGDDGDERARARERAMAVEARAERTEGESAWTWVRAAHQPLAAAPMQNEVMSEAGGLARTPASMIQSLRPRDWESPRRASVFPEPGALTHMEGAPEERWRARPAQVSVMLADGRGIREGPM